MDEKNLSSKASPKRRYTKKPSVRKVSDNAMGNSQLSLFQRFLCNTDEERSQLSNTIALWDSIPRYSVSRQAMTKMRSPEGRLEPLKLDFRFGERALRAVIHPARIEVFDKEKGNAVFVDYYPSATEELVEDALRKIAAEEGQGFYDNIQYASGVKFTLYKLSEELRMQGHSRSLSEILMSLNILAQSTIRLTEEGERATSIAVSAYFPALAGVTINQYREDPTSSWAVQFHPLVTASIEQLTYRQFNYARRMRMKSQLSRWIYSQLCIKFTFASIGRTFDMRFSTVERDSKQLSGYSVRRKAYAKLEESFTELKEQGVLMDFQRKDILGPRRSLEDAIFTLTPSLEFIREMKAANKRAQVAQEARLNKNGNPILPDIEGE